jgi:hypothetical protein
MRDMRRLAVALAVLAGMTATAGSAATVRAAHRPLTGTWRGVLSNGSRKERITLTLNPRQTQGTWRTSASCHGKLTLHEVSGGSHHYLRHLASGSTCAGGDIDCLWRQGKGVYDNVTPRSGGWSRAGTLRRVRKK